MEEHKKFADKVRRLIPDEDQRILMIMTLLGASGVLAEYVIKNYNINDIPLEVSYACALTASNMLSMISDAEILTFKDISEDTYGMGEQTQERLYRIMKEIVEELYKSLKEEEI